LFQGKAFKSPVGGEQVPTCSVDICEIEIFYGQNSDLRELVIENCTQDGGHVVRMWIGLGVVTDMIWDLIHTKFLQTQVWDDTHQLLSRG